MRNCAETNMDAAGIAQAMGAALFNKIDEDHARHICEVLVQNAEAYLN